MTDLPFSPAADRNKHAILEVMRQVLPPGGRMLEVASGTGQHAAWFGAQLPGWTWQPTEVNDSALPTIAAWCRESLATNVNPPCLLDAAEDRWPADDETLASDFGLPFDAIYTANMLHIAPWRVGLGLLAGAARHLRLGGLLLIYGPFFEEGAPPTPSNLAFDASLRAQDAQWGVRSLSLVSEAACAAGLELLQRFDMPANNLLLVFRQTRTPPTSTA
ncbi:MAG: DUF938 domain-containing protein [Burkholderiaceae bacterium]